MSNIQLSSLIRLQFRQLKREKKKNNLSGRIVSIIYFWVMEFFLFFIFKDEGINPPVLVTILIFAGILIPDFIVKLIFVPDVTVMDTFIKTRPISQSTWDRFLSISQFWSPSNLEMPLMMLPACFLFLPFLAGVISFILLYLASVFGGFIVMLIKHRGTYQPEKMVSAKAGGKVSASKGNSTFQLQLRSFLRSRRLKTMILYFSILFFMQFFCYSFTDNNTSYIIFQFYYIFFATTLLASAGFGIEANFFNLIWTRPLELEKLMTDKYMLCAFVGWAAALTCVPVCIFAHRPVLDPVSFALFTTGFVDLFMLGDSFNCTPFDLFGKAFFRGGSSSNNTFNARATVILLIAMSIGIVIPLVLYGWISQLILSTLGIAGFICHRRCFKKTAGRFMKNRYKYMEKYNSL